MKFKIEIDEFDIEDDYGSLDNILKKNIIYEVSSKIKDFIKDKVDEQITKQIKKDIELQLFTMVQNKIRDIIYTEQILTGSGRNKTSIKKYIIEKFSGEHRNHFNPDKIIREIAKKFSDELKQRYDIVFATHIVAQINEQGMLKEDVAKALLTNEE